MNEEKQHCKNCNTELHGEFCSSCGQRDNELHLPIKELVNELIDIIPSFDKRLFRSIKPFLFNPGSLTLEYLSGKRKSYISPFKLYFFVSFLYFLAGSFTDNQKVVRFNEVVAEADSVQGKSTKDSSFVSVRSTDSGLQFTIKDSSQVERVFGSKMKTALKKMKSNPKLMFDKIREHRPKIIFVLLPVFALMLKLLYYRSNVLYIKHLIFSFYFHAFIFFVFLLIVLLELTKVSVLDSFSGSLYLLIPINLYFGLKRVYNQTRWKTIIKLFLLMISYTMAFFTAIISAAFIIIYLFYL
jgi:hypothetical protein